MGGTLTHSVGSNTVANGLDVVVTDLLEVRVGGQINAVSKGIDGDCTAASGSRNIEQFYFANGTIQSGGISYLPSGSHGGTGVRASVTPFGSVSNPNEPGGTAGCGTLSGGVIRLTAKKLVNQGLITASVKGTNAITSYASGGAAGSINIQLSGTDPLTGSGRFLAKGGDGFPAYGAVPGAGGRIAVHGDTSALRLDQFDVRPGNYGGVYDPAGVGTLFFSGPLADYSMIHDVTVSGRDNSSVVPTSAATNWVVPANVTLILTEPSTTATELGDLTVSGEVVTNGPVSLKSLLVRGTGIVHPDVLTSASTSVRPKVDVTASGAITIDEGGQITASGLGFPAFGSTTNPLASCPGGPRPLTAITGAGFDCAPNTGARGGSHSVAGGAETGGFVWGDAAAPATPGGGGSVSTNATSTGGYDPRAGTGGGIIKLSAASLVINGSVTATGESAGATSATRSAGAGAGGSINIAVTGALSSPRSTGVISANGGSATTTTGPVHGGAGGLVKVVAGSRSGTVLVTSQGGAGVAGGTSGASTTPVEQ